jgi:hypothetical protein
MTIFCCYRKTIDFSVRVNQATARILTVLVLVVKKELDGFDNGSTQLQVLEYTTSK